MNSLRKYLVNVGVRQIPIRGLMLYLLYTFNFSNDVIRNIAMYPVTLYANCNQASDLWQQLGLASELATDLRDSSVYCMSWVKKWLVDFMLGKLGLCHLTIRVTVLLLM